MLCAVAYRADSRLRAIPPFGDLLEAARANPRAARRSDLLDLAVFQLNRGGAAEDGDADLHPATLLVDFLDRAHEAGEGAIGHPHLLAHLEHHGGLARLVHAFLDLVDDADGLGLGDRAGLVLVAEET